MASFALLCTGMRIKVITLSGESGFNSASYTALQRLILFLIVWLMF